MMCAKYKGTARYGIHTQQLLAITSIAFFTLLSAQHI